MSGHHPWSELTKNFTAEDRETVETGAAKIVADSDRRERLRESRSQPSRTAPRRTSVAPAEPAAVSGGRSRRIASS